MRVFISWSGEESRKVANALAGWIRPVINAVQPWTSEEMDKGSVWFNEITDNLGATNFGIVCVARENLSAPWLLFEAGAVWKATDEARVCTYLFDVDTADLKWPLKAFQATVADEPDTLKMLKTLNGHLGEDERLTDADLETSFGRAWEELADKFEAIRAERDEDPAPTVVPVEIQLANIAAALNRIERAQLESTRDRDADSKESPRFTEVWGTPRRTSGLVDVLARAQNSNAELASALDSARGDNLLAGLLSFSPAAAGESASVTESAVENDQETDSGK